MRICFLVDEDMPRSTARILRAEGFDAYDVRDIELRGHSDQDVFERAQEMSTVVLTADTDFANALRFPPGSHAGLVVSRIPDEVSTETLNRLLIGASKQLTPADIAGAIVIIEVHQIRIRRPIA